MFSLRQAFLLEPKLPILQNLRSKQHRMVAVAMDRTNCTKSQYE